MSNHKLRMSIALMKERLHRQLPLEELARAVTLSPSRLRHLFKVEVGMSPAKYRKMLRLQRARELMDTTSLSIKEIRNTVGLPDKRHFAKDFKQAFGLTPTEYRKRPPPHGRIAKTAP